MVGQPSHELERLIKKFSLPPGTNKAALQRVLERLDNGYDDERNATSVSNHERFTKPSAQTRSRTKNQMRTKGAATTANSDSSRPKMLPPDIVAPPVRAQSARVRQPPAPATASSHTESGRAPRLSRPAPASLSAGPGRRQDAHQQKQEQQEQQEQEEEQQQQKTSPNDVEEDPRTQAEEAMLQDIEDHRRQRTVGELRVRLYEQCTLNRELDTKLKKKEAELREARAKATQLKREKAALVSSADAAGIGVRRTTLTGSSVIAGVSGHAHSQRMSVLVKRCGAFEVRAARAEGELADAVERIAELESELEVFQESEASHYAKEKEMESELAQLRPLPTLLRSARADIKQMRRIVNASVGETALVKESLTNMEGAKFKLKSDNCELMQAKNKKDSKIFSLEERLREANAAIKSEAGAKAKVADEIVKLEDRMAMLRKRCAKMERALASERAAVDKLKRECALKEEECALMASMVSAPAAIVKLGGGDGTGNGKKMLAGAGYDDDNENGDVDSLIKALQASEYDEDEHAFEATLNNLEPNDVILEQKSQLVDF